MINRHATTRPARGFTLIELIVVVTIISLLALTILPGIIGLFKAGSDAQAYNVLAAMLSSARSAAIQRSTYVALHGQMAVIQKRDSGNWNWKDGGGNWYRPDSNIYSLAILVWDPEHAGWVLPQDYPPQALPGTIALGQVSDGAGPKFVDATGFLDPVKDSEADFTSFTILFSPTGTVVKQLNGGNIDLKDAVLQSDFTKQVFASGSETNRSASFWSKDPTELQTEPGVTAITLFDYAKLEPLTSASARRQYLNDNGQLIAINVYTGQLFPRK